MPFEMAYQGRVCRRAVRKGPESANGAALVTVSEDASGLNERRILGDVVLALAGADALVRPRLEKMGCA